MHNSIAINERPFWAFFLCRKELTHILNLSRNGFTHTQIVAALHAANRKIAFRYELLDKDNRRKRDLTNVISGEVSLSSLAQIKRTAKFSMTETADIDFLNDRIKPYMRLWIPKGRVLARYYAFFSHIQPLEREVLKTSNQEGWVEFPLGVFLLSSPTRKDETGSVIREVDAYDGLLVLRDDKFLDRYAIPEGTSYYEAIVSILASSGITAYNIEFSDRLLPRAIEFEPGKEKLFAVNELLAQINYTPVHVDTDGYYVSQQYSSPAVRAADYVYSDDALSVTFKGAEEELDLFSVPNTWTVIRSNEEQGALVSNFVNDNPNNPTSTVSRGRTIVDYREIEDIADQAALDAYVERIAFSASQVYGRIRFNTALMPFHDYANVLELNYSPLGISGKYAELNWTMQLQVGGVMQHEVRKIVDLGGTPA